jgi:plasmid stabilization system protein ParE
MRKVVWSQAAIDDFDRQLNHIAYNSRINAGLVADRVEEAIASLAQMPTGRFGRVSGTYEKFVSKTPLIIAYIIDDQGNLGIVRVIHAARDWPEGEWPGE